MIVRLDCFKLYLYYADMFIINADKYQIHVDNHLVLKILLAPTWHSTAACL